MKPNLPQGGDGKRRIFEKEMAELPRIIQRQLGHFLFTQVRHYCSLYRRCKHKYRDMKTDTLRQG